MERVPGAIDVGRKLFEPHIFAVTRYEAAKMLD